MKYIHIVAPKTEQYGWMGGSHHQWDVGYHILTDKENVKFLSCDFGNRDTTTRVIVTKVEPPWGVRYYISLPDRRRRGETHFYCGTVTDCQQSLLNEDQIINALKNAGLIPHDAFALAKILQDIGDF